MAPCLGIPDNGGNSSSQSFAPTDKDFYQNTSSGSNTIDKADNKKRSQSKGNGNNAGKSVPASAHQEIRQPARILRPMPGVPDKMEVESDSPRMGALRRGVRFLTVATALLSNCLGRFMDQPAGDISANPVIGLPYGTSAYISTTTPSTFDWSILEETGTSNADGTRCGGGDARADARPSAGGGRIPTLEPSQRRPRSLRPRVGLMKRLSGILGRSSKVLQTELKIYEDLPAAKDIPKIDIMEMFAGNAEITHLAHRYDLKALQPFDLKYGIDLLKKGNRDLWKQSQTKYKPLVVVVETDCNPWNISMRTSTTQGETEWMNSMNFEINTDHWSS